MLQSLGLGTEPIQKVVIDDGIEALWERVRSDDAFVKAHQLESLRELVEVPYQHILPPRFHKSFAASVKFTFTRDGEKTIPVVPKSLFNVIVTNTEKIRIQKDIYRDGVGAEGPDAHGACVCDRRPVGPSWPPFSSTLHRAYSAIP